jgi:RNA polymerase sigma-70 factor (ECF subfamily)
MIPDDQIIDGCMAGKRKSFSLLYKKYASVMLGVCMRYCKNRIDAEDVMQDGFLKVFSQVHKFRREGSFEGWIKRIMINAAIDNYQSNLRLSFIQDSTHLHEHAELIDAAEDDDDLPEALSISKQKLMVMIQQLPDGYRMVFNLYAIEGFGHKDIAAMLGITESTSKTQLLKARKVLRKKIESMVQNYPVNKVVAI